MHSKELNTMLTFYFASKLYSISLWICLNLNKNILSTTITTIVIFILIFLNTFDCTLNAFFFLFLKGNLYFDLQFVNNLNVKNTQSQKPSL